jgi:hypothetical protein
LLTFNSNIMKTITLLVASILLAKNVTVASELSTITDDFTTTRYTLDEPLSFTERGIEFFVFANGEFDFNTRPDDSNGDYNYRKAGNKTSERCNPTNFGVVIEQDSFGRVRRIGNTFINYNYADRVSRIGSVYMKYNRYALSQIGGMKLVYNRKGEIVDTYGSIKGHRKGFTFNDYSLASNHYNSYNYNNNNDYYYYRTDGTKSKIEGEK